MGRKPIASPLDDFYQGRGVRPSDIDLGKFKGGTEEELRKLMGPRARGKAKFKRDPLTGPNET